MCDTSSVVTRVREVQLADLFRGYSQFVTAFAIRYEILDKYHDCNFLVPLSTSTSVFPAS